MAPSAHILLIEDDTDIASMYQQKLKSSGFQVTLKRDGAKGWQALQDKRPDLLLLDIVLPQKDGFDILKQLRSHPKLHDLKVILLTNLGQKDDIALGKKLGADDYVIKARITPSELITKVNRHLSS